MRRRLHGGEQHPHVGKQQVIHEREMHWLRIDRYYEGTPEAPDMLFQPVLCQHCEQAPCESFAPSVRPCMTRRA